jgi:DNA polymerase delta subunit 1
VIYVAGSHTRSVTVVAPTVSAMANFAIKKMTCLSCKGPIEDKSSKAVCSNCVHLLPALYTAKVDEQEVVETKFAKLWTQCQRCQGSLHQEVICTSQDCPIFYMRKKAQKDLVDTGSMLERFQYEW